MLLSGDPLSRLLLNRAGSGCFCIPSLEKLGRGCVQCFRDKTDIFQANVAFAPLDAADVAPIEADPMRKLFLAPALGFPKLSYSFAEESFNVGFCHNVSFFQLTTKFPRVISTRSLSTESRRE